MSNEEMDARQNEGTEEIAEEELGNVAGGCGKPTEYNYPEMNGKRIDHSNWKPACKNELNLMCCGQCAGYYTEWVPNEGVRGFCNGHHKRTAS